MCLVCLIFPKQKRWFQYNFPRFKCMCRCFCCAYKHTLCSISLHIMSIEIQFSDLVRSSKPFAHCYYYAQFIFVLLNNNHQLMMISLNPPCVYAVPNECVQQTTGFWDSVNTHTWKERIFKLTLIPSCENRIDCERVERVYVHKYVILSSDLYAWCPNYLKAKKMDVRWVSVQNRWVSETIWKCKLSLLCWHQDHCIHE